MVTSIYDLLKWAMPQLRAQRAMLPDSSAVPRPPINHVDIGRPATPQGNVSYPGASLPPFQIPSTNMPAPSLPSFNIPGLNSMGGLPFGVSPPFPQAVAPTAMHPQMGAGDQAAHDAALQQALTQAAPPMAFPPSVTIGAAPGDAASAREAWRRKASPWAQNFGGYGDQNL